MSEVEDLINCPNCAESIKADAILCSFCQYGLSREHFSECNYCGEMVRKGTLWCQYCKSSLIETEPAHGRSPRPLSGLKKSAEQPASEEGMAEIGLAKFQANQSLIRGRVKVIVNRLRREVNLAVKS